MKMEYRDFLYSTNRQFDDVSHCVWFKKRLVFNGCFVQGSTCIVAHDDQKISFSIMLHSSLLTA